MNANNWWFECCICKMGINTLSESRQSGACAECRDRLIPNYIPLEQHKLYIDKYLKENHELYNM